MSNTENTLPHVNTIANSIPLLEKLVDTLDTAYWETNCITVKDRIYDCISALHHELRELGKLSIQDHDMPYEPISQEFKAVTGRFTEFHSYVKQHIVRHGTHVELENCIAATQTMLNNRAV